MLLAGDAATNDLLDGVDTTWTRVPGGAEIARAIDEAIATFNAQDPAAAVPALLAIRRRLAGLPADPVVSDKRAQLDRIIQACLGLEVDTVADRAEVVPGERVKLRHTAVVRSRIPVRWTAVRYPSVHRAITKAVALRPNQPVVRDASQVVPASTPPSQPYWLRTEGTVGLFDVDDPSLIGRPENPPAFPLEYVFEVGGQTLVIAGEPRPAADPAAPALRRRLEVIAPVSAAVRRGRPALRARRRASGDGGPHRRPRARRRHRAARRAGRLERDAGLAAVSTRRPGRARALHVHRDRAAAARDRAARGERGDQRPALQPAAHRGSLRSPAAAAPAAPGARPRRCRSSWRRAAATSATCRAPATTCPPPWSRWATRSRPLTGADLTPERLRGLDAVVIGIRAFNVRTDLAERLPALFAYVEAGGTVVAQYNTLDGLREGWLAPFQLHLSRDRVTDEHAPVTILAPEHPVLTTPNRITAADFEGWVQERGLYFPDRWDERFTADPRLRRRRRAAAQGRPAGGAARQRLLRLHQPGVVSPASRRRARRVSAVRESRLAGQMTPAPRPDEPSEAEPPDVPGFRTWRGIYLFVFGWFVLVVILLTVFTGIFA